MADTESSHPLANVILCCTSISPEERTTLADIATEMGAQHKLDLTTDVTHLLVGEIDTPKYKYVAKERLDIKVLRPAWVQAVQEEWLQGGDTDVERLEEAYRLPIFFNLKICVTGFDDLETRKYLESTVNANGGSYHGDLTREVTHLVTKRPVGAKYDFARTCKIHVVSLDWFEQSLERGMVLLEELFDPCLDVSQRGRGAWNRAASQSAGKRPRAEPTSGPRKLRRTASIKWESKDGIWNDLVGAKELHAGIRIEEHEKSLQLRPLLEVNQDQSQGIFRGKKFYLEGFDSKKTEILQRHLLSHDATLLVSMDLARASESSFVLVPHDQQVLKISEQQGYTVVTDMWIERCLHKRTYVDWNANTTSKPWKYPLEGFQDLKLSTTGFEDVDLLHVSKLIKLLGATFEETLTDKASLLISHDLRMREKIHFAFEWAIPVVQAEWLWESVRRGQRLPVDGFLFLKSAHPTGAGDSGAIPSNFDSKVEKLDSRSDISKLELESSNLNLPNLAQVESIKLDSSKRKSSTLTSRQTTYQLADTVVRDGDTFQSIPTQELEDQDPIHPSEVLLHRLSDSPSKRTSPRSKATSPPPDDMQPLNSELCALIALRKKQSSTSTTTSTRNPRRNRRLLGRATSNLSTTSRSESLPLSRTSSLASMNTDGIGTPLQNASLAPLSVSAVHDVTAQQSMGTLTPDLTHLHDAGDEMPEDTNEQLPMTQLGYEDPEADWWRAQMMKKNEGLAPDETRKPPAERRNDTVTVKDLGEAPIGRRTRMSVAR